MPAIVKNVAGKANHYGIEVVSNITWQGWEPGSEYTKNITLKNVKVKTQKIKYNVPGTRFFTTLYPKPIVLSAGTSFTLPVTFRPLEKSIYEDKIEFFSNEGKFEVPIKAVLPVYKVSSPDHLAFNMCAAHDCIELAFDIKNHSELETPFKWTVDEPFVVEPASGMLQPFGTARIRCTFKPKLACVYEVDAVCEYGSEESTNQVVTRLEGIGKLPHLLATMPGMQALSATDLSEPVLKYGDVGIGQSVEKYIELHNLSAVNARFRIDHPTGLSRIDTVFTCPQRHGEVPAMQSVKVPIYYSPDIVNAQSVDYFHVSAIGNLSKTVIKCVGNCVGPKVVLSTNSVNFFQIDAHQVGTKTLMVTNTSNLEAAYNFAIDCEESVFKLDKVAGVLKPGASHKVVVRFAPVHAINYYRRLACVVENQEPLFVDLIGTCHSETLKPAVLQAKHIDCYKALVERGLSIFPPEHLNELLDKNQLEVDSQGALMSVQTSFLEQATQEAESLEPLCTPFPLISSVDEYFNDGYHSDVTYTIPHVSVDVFQADFGRCTVLRGIDPKIINVTNHTKGKITVQWMTDETRTFSVSPTSLDIPPLKACSFRITFKPNAPNQFYGSELECYCYYKSLRDYKLVEDRTHIPPWCLTVVATGHTFYPNNETFLPRFNLDTQKLVFPAVNTHEAAYRTITLSNTGTTPILFDFEKESSNSYSMKPSKGLLRSGHNVITVKFLPTKTGTFKNTLKLHMNDDHRHTMDILAFGSAECAEVLLSNDGELFFKPTCVNTVSSRKYSVKNIARIPLRFQWVIHSKDAPLISVSPQEGLIYPNESQEHMWYFTPQVEEKQVMKPVLNVWGQGLSSKTSGGKQRQFAVRAVGEGSVGTVKCEQSYYDCGNIVVGSSQTCRITIYNDTNCSVHYKLTVVQKLNGPYTEEQTMYDKCALVFEQPDGILSARSKKELVATVYPARRVYYQFTTYFQLLQLDSNSPLTPEPQHLCHILCSGVYPTIAVTDARCYGSAAGVSKKQLWSLFSCDNLNVCLDSDPSAAELMYTMATRHSHRRRPPVYTRAILDFNFSAAPVDSEPCVILLMFENTGTVPTEWAFLFPRDLQLELEYWAETGEYDDDELHEMKVMDNKLFSVEPNRGSLQPGECQTIKFQYNHCMAGTDRLPVLLKLNRGREILLNFIGVTVDPERPYIHFPSTRHMFAPVPIGEKNSPRQVYELYNGGSKPVHYEIDTLQLEFIKQENFNHAIFECLNPVGEVLPGKTANVEWRFSPLEAKTYMADVPIHIHNGDTALITFTGVGFDKRALGDTMPLTDQHDLTGVPGVQSVPVPGQLIYLSQERLSFGNLPLFTRSRRMISVANKSMDRVMSFEWHVTSQADSKYVNIQPTSGVLQPDEAIVCKVTFIAFGFPSFYDLDLLCEATDETEMATYRKKLCEWEDELYRQKHEFTITEDDMNAEKRILDYDEPSRPSTGSQYPLVEPSPRPSSTDSLSKYKTLPPIKTKSADIERSLKKYAEKFNKEFWAKPEPPTPFLVHLGVTARTHNVLEYQMNFPEEYIECFVDRQIQIGLAELNERVCGTNIRQDMRTSPVEMVVCQEPELDIVTGAMTEIIRGLLDDTDFHGACQKIGKEPTPYFQQFGDKPSPPPSAASVIESHMSVSEDLNTISPGLEERLGSGLSAEDLASPVQSQTTVEPAEANEPDAELQMLEDPERCATPVDKSDTAIKMDEDIKVHALFEAREQLKRLPEFGGHVETLLENTVINIINEAFEQDFNITARPRLVALPPRVGSGSKCRVKPANGNA